MKTKSEYIALLKAFKRNHADRYGIEEMGVFGSLARDEAGEGSDVDIYIKGDPQSVFTMVHLKNELQNLLGCKVDIVRLRKRMNALLLKRIDAEGISV